MNCEQVEEGLSAYLDNMLAPGERREVTVHLQSCQSCRSLLAEMRRYDTLLAGLPRLSPSTGFRDRLFSLPEIQSLTSDSLTCTSTAPLYPPAHTRPLLLPEALDEQSRFQS